MDTIVWINDTKINALDFAEDFIADPLSNRNLRKISFGFKVTSEEYHDIAVLLYEMEFRIRVPEKNLDFQASISNYSTSVTDLYKPDQVADYYLELVEKL